MYSDLTAMEIIGIVLVGSGLFMMLIMPRVLRRNRKRGVVRERTGKILFIAGLVDIGIGLALFMGLVSC